MNLLLTRLVSASLIIVSASALAVTRYVDSNNPNPTPPYADWPTAATRIQDAIDASASGDEVVVTNGTYRMGGRVVHGGLTNRVAVTKPITLRSANGPAVTLIEGYQHPGTTNGNSSVRCVYLTHGASIFGFTLTNGTTRGSGDVTNEQSGAGIWCGSSSSVASNCIIIRNVARNHAGGAWSGTLIDCTVTNNLARTNGGGTALAFLTNCLVTGNYAGLSGGGVSQSILDGCTIRSNTAPVGGGTHQGSASKCTVSGNRASSGAGAYYGYLYDSLIAFNYSTNGGGAAASAILVGCTISNNASGTSGAGGVLTCTLTNCSLVANTTKENGGGAAGSTLYGCTLVGNSGLYGGGASGCTLFNSTISTNRANYGGGAAFSILNNCVLAGNFATNYGGGDYNGTSLTNCVLLANRAGIGGGGSSSSDYVYRCGFTNNSAVNGGGVYGSYDVYVIESTFDGNTATYGGAAFTDVWLISCLFANNRANNGGGSYSGRITNCIFQGNFATNYGGGVYGNSSYYDFGNSLILSNTATRGGGFYGETGARCFNSLFRGNQSTAYGGGAYGGELFNCTFVFNSAGSSGGGSHRALLRNSINYYNSAPTDANYAAGGNSASIFDPIEFTCTTPMPLDARTVFTNEPAFVNIANSDFRLQANSPCINSGYFNNFDGGWWVVGPDLGGNSRITGGTVDVGAYEYQSPTSLLSYAYAQQYGLPTDGSADFTDSDADGINNYSEWISGTNPSNATSALRVLSATDTPIGILVTWEGVPSRRYVLERATNVNADALFIAIETGIQAANRYDQTPNREGPYFYRVGVQHHLGTQYP